MSKIRLFLSSPGDVETERQKVHAVVAQINRMLGPFYQREIEVLDWKTHVVPDMGRAQEVINRQIQDYDVFVGIMWKRFGTPTGAAESGTEEEFNRAYQNWQQFGRPRILFYFSQADHTPKSKEETKQWLKVLDFKEQLTQKGLYWEYPSADEFDDSLREHLSLVLQEWFGQDNPPPPVADFNRYLRFLRDENMYLDIKGLASGKGTTYSLRIDQLYIPLKTSSLPDREEQRGKKSETAMPELAIREIPLEAALQQSRLIIKGEPGAGKTTFLRLLTFSLCQKWLGEAAMPTTSRLLWRDPPPLPILVRLGRLAEYIQHCKQHHTAHAPVALDSPECLFQFLDNQSRENNWKVTAADFRRELEAGHCVIFLDGLDEAPDLLMRETISELAVRLQRAYPACQVVLTSRPPALTDTTIPAGFALVEIAPLDDQAMQVFLKQWCAALYAETPAKALQHQQELFAALQARPDIRRMTRTPVMLTALAVVHWHENRLPEQRVELYESILGWLFKQRATRTGRLKADRCRKLVQKLALAMFEAAPGRLRQMTLH